MLNLNMLVNREVDWTLFHEDNQIFTFPSVRYGLLSEVIFVESNTELNYDWLPRLLNTCTTESMTIGLAITIVSTLFQLPYYSIL